MADRDFDGFYAANYGRFVVQLYAVTGSLPDAEDAVQEAFARASVHWDALARQLVLRADGLGVAAFGTGEAGAAAAPAGAGGARLLDGGDAVRHLPRPGQGRALGPAVRPAGSLSGTPRATVTGLAYGSRVRVSSGTPGNGYRFTVGQGAAGELSGSLSGGTPRATVTGLAAGAVCGE
jgi:hypothetical protein